MAALLRLFVIFLMMGALTFETPLPARAQYEAIVERTKPAVVLVAARHGSVLSTGTGFFLSIRQDT